MPQLIFYVEEDYPQIYDLVSGKITIGRNKDNDIRLRDEAVSVYHAELLSSSEGSYRLKDMESFNGTFINGEPSENTKMVHGDQIRFGSVKAVYLDLQKPAPEKGKDSAVKLDQLQKESIGLLRTSEIERNNLRLLKNDCKRVLAATEKSLKQKDELEAEITTLSRQTTKTKKELETNQERSAKLAVSIKEAQQFQDNVDSLKTKLKSRQKDYQAIDKKIAAKEKSYRELDLNAAIEEKKQLGKQSEQLNKDIETASHELDQKQLAAKDATQTIEEGKEAKVRLAKLNKELEQLELQHRDLCSKIDDRKATCVELDGKIAEDQDRLSKLSNSHSQKRAEVDKLSEMVGTNQGLIHASTEKLAEMENIFAAGRKELAESKELQNSLTQESKTLSQVITDKTVVLQLLKAKVDARKYGEVAMSCPPLRLINSQMRSLVHYFHSGAGNPDQDKVDPIGHYSLAACTKGSIHRDFDSILSGDDPIVIMLTGDQQNDRVQIDAITHDLPGRLILAYCLEGTHRNITADLFAGLTGIISVDAKTAKRIADLDIGMPHLNIPVPYPVEATEWDLSTPLKQRHSGIFISADGFDSTQTAHQNRRALLGKLANNTNVSFTLFHQAGNPTPDLQLPSARVRTISEPARYSDYLSLIGEHQLVTGFGSNLFGGMVSSDAILARTIYIGGDATNATDELLFPDCCVKDNDFDNALNNATRFLTDRAAYRESTELSMNLALQLISFETARDRIGEFINFVSSNLGSM